MCCRVGSSIGRRTHSTAHACSTRSDVPGTYFNTRDSQDRGHMRISDQRLAAKQGDEWQQQAADTHVDHTAAATATDTNESDSPEAA